MKKIISKKRRLRSTGKKHISGQDIYVLILWKNAPILEQEIQPGPVFLFLIWCPLLLSCRTIIPRNSLGVRAVRGLN